MVAGKTGSIKRDDSSDKAAPAKRIQIQQSQFDVRSAVQHMIALAG
jgi:hypothetical protein